MAHARPGNGFQKGRQHLFGDLVVNADTALYGNRHIGLCNHRGNTVGHQFGTLH